MHEHDVLKGLFVLNLDEEGILVACLLLEFDNVAVNVVYILIL
jgi:hypothetical protein